MRAYMYFICLYIYVYIYISLKVSWAPDFRVLDHMNVFAKNTVLFGSSFSFISGPE